MRLFLDANIVFSAAHNPDGNARALFKLGKRGGLLLTASSYAIDEATRNLALKFPDCIPDLEALTAHLVLFPEPSPAAVAGALEIGLPKKDAPILAAAITANADILVTGDRRHFGPLYGKTVHSVRIATPAEAVIDFLDRICRSS